MQDRSRQRRIQCAPQAERRTQAGSGAAAASGGARRCAWRRGSLPPTCDHLHQRRCWRQPCCAGQLRRVDVEPVSCGSGRLAAQACSSGKRHAEDNTWLCVSSFTALAFSSHWLAISDRYPPMPGWTMLLEIGSCSARHNRGLGQQEAHPWRARWAAQSCQGPRHAAECPPHAPAGRQRRYQRGTRVKKRQVCALTGRCSVPHASSGAQAATCHRLGVVCKGAAASSKACWLYANLAPWLPGLLRRRVVPPLGRHPASVDHHCPPAAVLAQGSDEQVALRAGRRRVAAAEGCAHAACRQQ